MFANIYLKVITYVIRYHYLWWQKSFARIVPLSMWKRTSKRLGVAPTSFHPPASFHCSLEKRFAWILHYIVYRVNFGRGLITPVWREDKWIWYFSDEENRVYQRSCDGWHMYFSTRRRRGAANYRYDGLVLDKKPATAMTMVLMDVRRVMSLYSDRELFRFGISVTKSRLIQRISDGKKAN